MILAGSAWRQAGMVHGSIQLASLARMLQPPGGVEASLIGNQAMRQS